MSTAAGAIRTQTVVAALRGSDLFGALDDDAAARIAQRMVIRRFRRDEVVFHQGDPGDRLHVIDSGRVRIGLDAQDGREGTLTLR
jgi:CRP-like cAMP-binding protein